MPFNKLVRVLLKLLALSIVESFRPRRADDDRFEVVLR
jgi:hypothetical protein